MPAVLASGLVMGCASLSKDRGHQEVGQLVEQRIGQKTSWEHGTPEDAAVAAHVSDLLEAGLTRARALEIALVNNPSLQATYEELGVSQADMVQAGLLPNPSLSGSIGFPSGGGRSEYETSLVQSFLDIFVLPLRRRVAEQQFSVDVLRVAHEALRVAAEVSKVFAGVQAETQLVELRREVVQGAVAAAELAERQHRAGNITDLALAQEQATYQQAQLDLSAEELTLAKLPSEEIGLERLESIAIRQRLDIDAARKQTLLLANAVALARTTRLFGIVQVGVHVHQDPDGPRLFGPTLSLELPIFDQRQALIAKLEAQQRQADRRLASLSVDARSEVRVARLEALTARRLVERYQKVLMPLREKVVEQSQLQYNGMQIGLSELLAAKRAQLEAYRAYIEAVHGYWVARAELERAVGGRTEPTTVGKESVR